MGLIQQTDRVNSRLSVAAAVGLALLLSTTAARSEDFHGSPCTEDCSGHEAGYNWAAEHSVGDPDDCSGNSQSFVEGCQAYATENGNSSDS
jgi:hypothetical protein